MSIWNKMYHSLQDAVPEKFNEEIFHLKEKDDIVQHITDACSSLETINGIEFLGAKRLEDRVLYKPSTETTDIPFERSRVLAVEFSFKLTDPKDESNTKIIKKKLYFPKLIDGCYYLIDGVRYYPIFQIVDAETYRTNNSITIRTSLQPIVINKKNIEVTPENSDETISGYYTFSKLFKNKIPIFLYFFTNFGLTNTLKYFNLDNIFKIYDKKKLNMDEHKDEYLFKLGTMIYLGVPKKYLNESTQNKMMVLTFLNSFQKKDRVSLEKINDKNYWIKKLGSIYTNNMTNFENKGKSVKISFERLLDDTTKRIIRIADSDKEDIYTLLRWFLTNYNNLLYQNNDDLANKRLRLIECFIFPLLDLWTNGVLRILNGKNTTLKTLESLFSSISPDFLVKKLKSSNAGDNLRYMNNVDSIDILNKLKLTIAGNQSISNSRGEIRGKTLDPSMLGQIDLIYTSNNDPGTTRSLTIGAQVNDTWHFSDEPNIISTTFEGDDIEMEDEMDFDIEVSDAIPDDDDDFGFDEE